MVGMLIVGIFMGMWMLRRAYKSYRRGYVSEWKKTHKTGKKFYKYQDPISFWTSIIAECVIGVGIIVLCLYSLNLSSNEGLPQKGPVFPLR